ncbi:hypothetical protein [Paraflavitalea speifideaquila]|nr:hypothetical protein [Paraflavitalea speifideiaquila]
MAKVKPSLIKLAGTIDDYTIVDSIKYGRHARRKRGTVKPAKLNSN